MFKGDNYKKAVKELNNKWLPYKNKNILNKKWNGYINSISNSCCVISLSLRLIAVLRILINNIMFIIFPPSV